MDDRDPASDRFSETHLLSWIRRIVVGARPKETLLSTDDAWSRLDARIHETTARRGRGRSGWWGGTSTPARALMAIAGLGAAALIVVAVKQRSAESAGQAGAYTVYSTRAGQRATLSLRDGTRVTLNVASTLEVPRDFGAGRRNVHLIGEAMFDVAPNARAPFTVDAAGVRTRVLGTTFGVRAYDGAVRVAVQSGRVAVVPCDATVAGDPCRNAPENTILGASDIAAVTPLGDVRVRHAAGVAAELAFANGRLVFTGAPLRDVIDDLNRWYDVDVRVTDTTLANRALSGSLPQGTADALAQALEVILGAHVTRHGRVVTVSAGER